MIPQRRRLAVLGIVLLVLGCELAGAADLPPIPDKLVVLTFDDGAKSDVAFVAPLLKRYGFGATFFITEGLKFLSDKQHTLTWEEIRKLHDAGFEIGNHTRSHPNMATLSREQIVAEVEHIENRFKEHGIPTPKTFCYPAYKNSPEALKVLEEKGYLFARRGVAPEFPYSDRGDRGPAYDPQEDHPLLVPTTGASGPDSGWEDFVWAVQQAKNGKICVLNFHGVPDVLHPWVSTKQDDFAQCMKYLHDQGCTVIALRNLAKYVDPAKRPNDPYAPIERRLGLTPVELRCEYAVNPLGIDVVQPRFSWVLQSSRRGQMQSAYQVLVASSEEKLRAGTGDKWDSGKVDSDESVHVTYQGKALGSGEKCWWKVRVWDKDGKAGGYSEPATFEMGLLKPSDWQGKWIGAGKEISSPLLRKEFRLEKEIRRARAYICGLGWYELYINGRKVGDHVLDPATTDYQKRTLYVTYDVTKHLRQGPNVVGVMLANGWYSRKGAPGGSPKLILQINLEFMDGKRASVVTDDTFKVSGGPITASDLCHGESYDARLEKPGWNTPGYNDSDWDKAPAAEPPGGRLHPQLLPPIRVVKTIPPVKLLQPQPNVYVYDFGQHFSGWARLRVRGPRGTELTLRYAGRLYDDGRLDRRNNLSAAQTDTYIVKGNGEEVWEPRFTLHGFRYAEVTGFPGVPTLENLEGRFVRSAVEPSGSFTCSNPLINQIHQNVCWTLMTSFQGIPQDAAERDERVGWLGDPGFVAESYLYNFDTASFWAKWLEDIKEAQKPDGDVPVVCPNPIYQPWPCWQSTYPLFVWYLYQYYGDQRIVETHYDGLKKLVDLLSSRADDGVVPVGLGDHMEPQADGTSSFRPRHTPAALTSTAYYYFDTRILAEAAKILGKTADARHYSDLTEKIKAAFNRKFFNETTNQYATGSQTSNAVALYLGLVPEERQQAVLKNLVDDILINHKGHLSTGIIGTNALQQALPEYGRADVMYTIGTQTTFPSWGYQISKGATTVWECFEVSSERCVNMKMFGSTEKFFYKDLGGIGLAGPGFKKITIKPCVVGDLTYAKASLKTVRGLIAVDWEKKNPKSFRMSVTIPANTTAGVSVPKTGLKEIVVTESGKPIWKDARFVAGVSGIAAGSETDEYVTFGVSSGFYAFQLTGQ
ncbi:MAG: family 78 glycoside hydrolase catalytic domain [Planctomycetota bacterium]|nr:family 78 glycoside hydrolase catalytic domain [Planctomycetota bacterium]